MPKVSVVIPVYGVEKFIERCARSLFEQSLDDIEYLFIDDCTPDRSIEILKHVLNEYPQRKSQVIIHHLEQNSGQAVARSTGIQLATGDYVIHCDSDDWVDCDIYKILYDRAQEDNFDIVFCDYFRALDDINYVEVHKTIKDCSKSTLIRTAFVSCELNPLWNALIRRRLYADVIHPKEPQGEDKTYMIQLIWRAQTFAYVPKSLYYYRDNPQSITNNNSVDSVIRKHFQYIENQKIILELARKNDIVTTYKEEIDVYKLYGKLGLCENLQDPRCVMIWENAYPEIKYRILINKHVAFKVRLLLFMILFKLYIRKIR